MRVVMQRTPDALTGLGQYSILIFTPNFPRWMSAAAVKSCEFHYNAEKRSERDARLRPENVLEKVI